MASNIGRETTRGRHADFFLELARTVKLHGPRQIAHLEMLESEHANFRAALAWSLHAGQAETVLGLAELGDSELAAQLFGAVGNLVEKGDHTRWNMNRAEHDRGIAIARAKLGKERFAELLNEGRAMSLEQAVELALK